MGNPTRKYKINGVIPVKEFEKLVFGRQIEVVRKFQEFKHDPETKSAHVSQKRVSAQKSIKEFLALNDVKEFYTIFHDKKNSPDYWEDTFEIFYKN